MRRLIVLVLSLSASPAFAGNPPRVELPVREVDLSDGTRRYSVSLQIDGQAVEAGLDTGSTGLRVLPRALGDSGRSAQGPQVSYSYGSGTAFDGTAIRQSVAFGAVAGTITLMRIDTVGCRANVSTCPAARVDAARFGIQGDGLPGEGFPAILGIRTTHDPVDNPFVQLGAKRWIIDLPRPGETSGRIILNPTDDEVLPYRRVSIDAEGRSAGCLSGPQPTGRLCGPAFFDTGAPGFRVLASRVVPVWPSDTPATLTVGEGAETQSMIVAIGRRDQASGMFSEVRPRADRLSLSFGLAPYFHWSVLYDAAARQIGLKTR